MSTCAFKSCKLTKRPNPNLHMFRFPVKDKERCMAWVENTGCSEKLAHLEENKLASKVVCALHFKQSSFMNYLCCRLNQNAVPVAGFVNKELLPMLDKHKTKAELNQLLAQRDPNLREQSKQKFVSCDPEPMVSECAGSSTPAANNERDPLDIVDDFAAEAVNQEGGDEPNEAKCGVTAEQRAIITKTDLVDAISKYLSGPPLTLFRMQILRSGDNDSKSEWAVEEKELALIMYYKSAPLYKYLRDRQHFTLPSDADIQHWINCTKHSSF